MKKLFSWVEKVVSGFLRNKCTIHAAALTYFSLLTVVPLLCCILVVAKACGIDSFARDQINYHIDRTLSEFVAAQEDPLAKLTPADEEEREKKRIAAEEFAEQARKISNDIFTRIDQFDMSTIGWIGFGLLLWSVVSTLSAVETSFNAIFGAPKDRPIWKRVLMYSFMMVILPILAAAAMSLQIMRVVKDIIVATLGATWLTKWVSDGLVAVLDSKVFGFSVALLFASVAFASLYWAIPNRKVPWRCAFRGGFMTAFVFGCWMKVCAVAQVGIAKSSALYGSFAFVPIVLTWLYIGWQIALFGANVVHSLEPTEGESP